MKLTRQGCLVLITMTAFIFLFFTVVNNQLSFPLIIAIPLVLFGLWSTSSKANQEPSKGDASGSSIDGITEGEDE
jgi:hypothetical protein